MQLAIKRQRTNFTLGASSFSRRD